MKTPETHTRYRVQRLIHMGEWLERNEAALVLAYDVLDEAHDKMIDPDETLNPNDLLDIVGHDQMQALLALRPMMMELRTASDWDVKRGTDVTIRQPYACSKHRYEVVMEAPKPVQKPRIDSEKTRHITDNTPTNKEFNKTRSQVDV